MLDFIEAIRSTDRYISDIFLKGGCYRFHKLLRKYADCEPFINAEKTHVVTLFKGKYFDINGIAKGKYRPLYEDEIKMVEQWSFANQMSLTLGECEVCGEPIKI